MSRPRQYAKQAQKKREPVEPSDELLSAFAAINTLSLQPLQPSSEWGDVSGYPLQPKDKQEDQQ